MILIISTDSTKLGLAQVEFAKDYANLHGENYTIVQNYSEALNTAQKNNLSNIICDFNINNTDQMEFLKKVRSLPYYKESLIMDYDQLENLVKAPETSVQEIDEDLLNAFKTKKLRQSSDPTKFNGSLKLSANNSFDVKIASIFSLTKENLVLTSTTPIQNFMDNSVKLRLTVNNKHKEFEFNGMITEADPVDCDKDQKFYYILYFDENTKQVITKIMEYLSITDSSLNLLLLGGK